MTDSVVRAHPAAGGGGSGDVAAMARSGGAIAQPSLRRQYTAASIPLALLLNHAAAGPWTTRSWRLHCRRPAVRQLELLIAAACPQTV